MSLAPGQHSLRVVVIDGDRRACEATIALCRQCGVRVNGWAHDGTTGLELVESLPAAPDLVILCLLYTSPSPRDGLLSRMPSSA